MSRLGLGILAAPAKPPAFASMILWLDPEVGVTESGGFVDSWASRVGSAVFSAVGAARPAYNGSYLDFDGVDDFLSRAADANSHPVNAPIFTWAGWTRRATSNLEVIYSSVPLFTASGGIFVQDSANVSRQYYPNVSGNWTLGSPLPLGSWVFRAAAYDSSLPLGSRMTVYEGATPSTVALVAPGLDTSVGPAGPAAGTSCVGRDADLGRYFGGDVATMGVWSGTSLTLPQAAAFAALSAPPGV